MTKEDAQRRATKGIAKGLLKTISKMGISTIPSYCGAQIFEAVGLSKELVDRHFTGTASRIGGIGLDVLARETLNRHARAYPGQRRTGCCRSPASTPGAAKASSTQWNPDTIALLQHAVRAGGYETYGQYSQLVNDDSARRSTLRGLLRFRERRGRRHRRSTRSSPRRRSSSASRPARCRSARSRARRTRTSRSR